MKKGFTLIELLLVITVVSVIGISAFTTFENTNESTKTEELNNDYRSMQRAALLYIDINKNWLDTFNDTAIDVDNAMYVKLGELQSSNYFTANKENPFTGEIYPSTYFIKIYFDCVASTCTLENSFLNTCIVRYVNGNETCVADNNGIETTDCCNITGAS